VRTSRFTPGFVVRNGGLLPAEDVGADVDGTPEPSPAGERAEDGVTSSPAISAMFLLDGGPGDSGRRTVAQVGELLRVLGLELAIL
jgi:hypothetical protein